MNPSKHWLRLGALLLLLLPQFAAANEVVAPCNGCNESAYAAIPHDYAAVQQELHRENPWWFAPLQPTTYYVYDLPNRQVRAYAITPQGSHAFAVQPTGVPSEFAAATAYLSDVYAATGGTMKFYFEFSADPAYLGGMTAFDVARPGAAQHTLAQWVNWYVPSSNPLSSFAATLYTVPATVVNVLVANDVQTLIRVTFPDGSTVVVKYNFLEGGASVVPGSARDALGNPIPANDVEAVDFDYNYSGNDPATVAARNAMLDWLNRLRASYTGLSCAWDGVTITCSRH